MMRSFAGIGVITTVHITDNSLNLKKKIKSKKKRFLVQYDKSKILSPTKISIWGFKAFLKTVLIVSH